MENVILVIHLILALGIIGLVLIQRSEGGGLGIGGGGGGLGGFATPRGTASVLTKLTALFAACFFATSLTLAILAGTHNNSAGILDTYNVQAEGTIQERTEDAKEREERIKNENAGEEAAASAEDADVDTSSESGEASDAAKPVQKPSVPIGE